HQSPQGWCIAAKGVPAGARHDEAANAPYESAAMFDDHQDQGCDVVWNTLEVCPSLGCGNV
ncbi:MAG: hypothetical protein VKI82_16475, partial [Leptolyngbya sp.]|nr:hypothetical protein [Leptolyngbya sp.]